VIDIEYKPKFLRKFNQLPEALKVEVEEKISLFLAITDHTFTNYLLPAYMTLGSLSITLPLAIYRWKRKDPWSEWL